MLEVPPKDDLGWRLLVLVRQRRHHRVHQRVCGALFRIALDTAERRPCLGDDAQPGVFGGQELLSEKRVQFHLVHGGTTSVAAASFCRWAAPKLQTPIARTRPSRNSLSATLYEARVLSNATGVGQCSR
jgi:hypothetical protein